MSASLRWRLVATYLFVALTAAVAVGAVTYFLVGAYFARQEQAQLTQAAQEVAGRLQPVLLRPVHRARLERTAEALAFLVQSRVRVFDPEGNLLADAPPSSRGFARLGGGAEGLGDEMIWIQPAPFDTGPVPGHEVPRPPLALPLDGGLAPGMEAEALTGWIVVSPGAGRFRLDASTAEEQAITRSDQRVRLPVPGWLPQELLGYVELSEGPAYGAEVLAGLRMALAGGGAAAIVIALVAGLLTARQVSAPLRLLEQATERMAAGELSARAPADRRDEFGQLARQFNRMAERLSATIAALETDRHALRRFIADASHELRTPLTALKTFQQLLRQSPGLAAEPAATFLAQSALQVERLEGLTRDLLDLSRLESGLMATDFVVEDVRPLIGRLADGFRAVAESRQLEFRLDMPASPVIARYDPSYLRRAVENLVHNALKFTPPGGSVTVGITGPAAASQDGRAQGAHIWVADTGPGIDPAEVELIFGRFSRGRTSGGQDGSGLGLAIVRAVAEAHGGRVSVQPLEPHGARFELELPAYAE